MSWSYLPELVEESLSHASSGTVSLEQLNLTSTGGMCSCRDSETKSCRCSRSGMTSGHLMDDHGVEKWISCLEDSRASLLVERESAGGLQTQGTCGQTPIESFAKYDPDARSWKTLQDSLLPDISEQCSETWPKAGMTRNGYAIERHGAEPITDETDSGFWPTPCKSSKSKARANRYSRLRAEGKMGPGGIAGYRTLQDFLADA